MPSSAQMIPVRGTGTTL